MDLKNSHISFVNLAHRQDRLAHTHQELCRIGLIAKRFDAIKTTDNSWNRHPYQTMFNRTRGAIGCMLSQIAVMEEALHLGKDAIVLEDDIIFSSQIRERLEYIEKFVNEKQPNTDVVWLGGTVHINPPYWHKDKDCEYIGDKRMFRSYGSFSTHAYIVHHKSIEKVIKLLTDFMPYSIGIDYSFIKLSHQMFNLVHLPGSVIQKDNISDIGQGAITYFSHFSSLGQHWFQDKIEDFDFDSYKWGETKK